MIFAVPALLPVTVPLLLTVATEVLSLDHVTVLLVAVDGLTVAVILKVSPTEIVFEVGLTLTPVTATVPVTVTLQVAVFPPSAVVTVIVAVPAFTPVRTPLLLSLNLAIEVSLLVHVTFLSVASEGVIFAVSVTVLPIATVGTDGEIATPVTGLAPPSTLNVQEAVYPPSSVVAVTVAVPALIAVTLPFESTLTILLLLVLHLTLLSVALEGEIVAVKVVLLPVLTVREEAFSVIPSTACFTVTSQASDAPPADAVIVASPAFTAVTSPFSSTTATLLLLLAHVTAALGFTVAFSFSDAPTFKFKVDLSNFTLV